MSEYCIYDILKRTLFNFLVIVLRQGGIGSGSLSLFYQLPIQGTGIQNGVSMLLRIFSFSSVVTHSTQKECLNCLQVWPLQNDINFGP